MKTILVLALFTLFRNGFAQTSKIDISGDWEVVLDKQNEWIIKDEKNSKTQGPVLLPGSLAENSFGYKTEGSDFGILTPAFKYIGKAWYSREIQIPVSWENKEIDVYLERVLWESRIYIDRKELSVQDALGTPHVHRLGRLQPGKHKLTIQVDNEMIHNIGDKGHAYSDYTQGIWNGIVGRMELQAYDLIRIESVRTFSDVAHENLHVEINLNLVPDQKALFNYSIRSVKTGEEVLCGTDNTVNTQNGKQFFLNIQANGRLKKWSEFTPEVYRLEILMNSGKSSDYFGTEFGFCQVSHDGTKIMVNGQPVFLRGNLDCVHFPLTGYPSCKLEDWERIFRIYKDYGLNHARFHSWCPPEAAFKAANRLGIYLQVEASIWIDWWMSTDMTAQGRPEMDTKGHPEGVGKNPVRDKFIVAEMNRMVDYYGNHPSFLMFCIGNELGNGDFDAMHKWIADLKTKDPRRLYAASTARQINKSDDFSATHHIPDVGRTRGLNGARTDWDFQDIYGKMDIPIIAHEIGQWPVYPRWSEIEKYTGVLKARNLIEFRETAIRNGIAEQNEDFAKASGSLNQIMYKYEIESFLRTGSCAGIQLLSMQDYQGQGEALIGWLDCHWQSKDITTPAIFRKHHNTTVPLLRMAKFVWTNDETFTASAQLSHYGQNALNGAVNWQILNGDDNILAQGTFGKNQFEVATLTDLGEIEFNLKNIQKAEKLTIDVEIDGTDFSNQWNIWVYPHTWPETENSPVIISDELNDEMLAKLQNGASVLLVAHKLGTPETSVAAHFYPLYWSLTFFPGQGKTCIGLLLQENHPAFAYFPTAYHSDWQWETISTDAKGFILNDLPREFRPLAQPVDDFHRNNKVGSIFEVKAGRGKLLICGYNLHSGLPAADQLKESLTAYMAGTAFNPQTEVDAKWLRTVFPVIHGAEKTDIQGEFNTELSISHNDMVFNSLAASWDEAVPLGNAMLGALVWEKEGRLRFSLDRADLWDLRPVANLSRPEFSFKWVQEQVKNNSYEAVQDMFDVPYDLMPAPSKIPGAALEFESSSFGKVKNVRLDIAKALCRIEWENGAQLETFVHADDQAGWFRFRNVPDGFQPCIIPPQYQKITPSGFENPVTGQDLQRLEYQQGQVELSDNRQIYREVYRQKGWNGFEYEVAVSWKTEDHSVAGVWSISSTFSESEGNQPAGHLVERKRDEESYDESFAKHCNWWKTYWLKSYISLPDSLLEKQYYLEMYKFGSVARPDAPPISLQAVWTADNGKLPPWKGDFHHDLNTQLSYWPAYTGNHLDLEYGFINWLWKYKKTFKEYTETYFGTAGLNVPGVTTLTGQPMGGWIQYSFGPTVASWLAHHFYLHWVYSMDEEFLKERAYPWLREVAVYLDEISVRDETGKRKLPISSSPEINDNSIRAWFSETTNFDLAFIRWNFDKAAELAEALGKTEEAGKWRDILAEWPEFSLENENGLAFAPRHPYEASHRHFSHLVAWHPLGIIDWANGEKDREIISSTLANMEKIGSDWWTGYSFSWMGNLYARAFDGDKAAQALRLFAECFCLKNSFHVNGDQCQAGHSKFTYRPFTLEGNFAFASGIQEMLIQSHTGKIQIFPAIPATWKTVKFKNLRAQGAFLINASMTNGKVDRIEVFSEKGSPLKLVNPFGDKNFQCSTPFLINGSIIEIPTKPGQRIMLW